MKNQTVIQLETQNIRNQANRSGDIMSANVETQDLEFTKEDILSMSDSEIKSKIALDPYYEHSDYCGTIFRIIETVYIEEDEESSWEILDQKTLKEYTFIEDGAYPGIFERSKIFNLI